MTLRPRHRTFIRTLVMTLAMVIGTPVVHAAVVADLDQKQVSITTDFNGAELLLFGALDLLEEDDIVIEVSGPLKNVAVRRKNKVAGIWLNTENVTLVDIPSFYHILSTRPLNRHQPIIRNAAGSISAMKTCPLCWRQVPALMKAISKTGKRHLPAIWRPASSGPLTTIRSAHAKMRCSEPMLCCLQISSPGSTACG